MCQTRTMRSRMSAIMYPPGDFSMLCHAAVNPLVDVDDDLDENYYDLVVALFQIMKVGSQQQGCQRHLTYYFVELFVVFHERKLLARGL